MTSRIKNDIQMEKEFSPSMWSHRNPSGEEVLKSFVDFCIKESDLTANRIPNNLDIEYGPTAGQKLDIFGTDLPDSSPILVYIHGGYWQQMSRQMSRFPAVAVYQCKIKTFVLGYDLCPAVTLTEIIYQIQRAITFVFEYAEKMGSKGIYFVGHCAGAYLVAKVLASKDFLDNLLGTDRLQGAFLLAGVYDLRELVHTTLNESIQLPDELAVSLSPMFDCFTHLKASKVRIHIVTPQYESPTFTKQSIDMYEHLKNSCLTQNLHFHIKKDMDHFLIVECFTNDSNYLKDMLLEDIRKHVIFDK